MSLLETTSAASQEENGPELDQRKVLKVALLRAR